MDDFSLESLLKPAFNEQAAKLKKFVDSLPAFSPATTKIVQLSSLLNAPPAEIVGAIRLDPLLTGKVLELINSAYFSLAERVTSLNRAVVYLGINTIKNLALSAAVMDAVGGKGSLKSLVFPAWQHSLTTAVCAKGIARASRVAPEVAEEYFIAGLLHFVGRIILIQAFHESHPKEWNLTPAEERNLFGTDHCEVGSDILSRWKFSDEMILAIRTYPTPSPEKKIPHVLNLASAMAFRLGAKTAKAPEGAQGPQYSQDSLSFLSLTETALESELNSVPAFLEKAAVFLGPMASV
jgi:HD-like signal output (HDOD) protein